MLKRFTTLLFTALLLSFVQFGGQLGHAQSSGYSNIRILGVTATTATIGWDTATATCGRINYGTAPNALNSGPAPDACYAVPNGTSFTAGHQATLTGLTQNTRYRYEIVSTNSLVTGELNFYFGNISVTDISVSDITQTTATVHFTTSADVCAQVNYGVASVAEVPVDECASAYAPTSVHSVILNGLTKDTSYFVNATVFDANGATSPTIQFQTLGDVVPAGSSAITSVNIVSVSATEATLTFTYSSQFVATDLRYTVNYGKTTKYGKQIANHIIDNNPIILTQLDPETTYHFDIQLLRSGASQQELAVSADRTFTTPRESGANNPLTIDKIRADCVDRSCTMFFSTNKDATVEVKWVLNTSSEVISFPATPPSFSETASAIGARSFRFPDASQTVLTANTKYRYRLHGRTVDNFEYTTGELTFTTSGSATDHLFATGQCSDGGTPPIGVDIGGCIGNRYCYGAGLLATDCTKCGYSCGGTTTCRAGNPVAQCKDDTALNGSANQCNESSCYTRNGVFITPASAKCYASWPRCNANTILKVRKDRGCNLWLTCATSIQTDASSNGPADNLCLNLGACNSLNTKGQCNHYLPLGQCSNDALRFCNQDTDCQGGGTCNNPDPNEPTRSIQTLTFQTPKDVKKIADLSGNVIAGLDWGLQGGTNVIQGNLPWQLMRQIGGTAQIKNGDMEFNVPSIDPWEGVPIGSLPKENIKIAFEDRDSGPNHILSVDPRPAPATGQKLCEDTVTPTNPSILKTCFQNSDCNPNGLTTGVCVTAGKCTAGNTTSIGKACTSNNDTICDTPTLNDGVCQTNQAITFSGVRSSPFSASAAEYYYAEARIRSTSSPLIRMQFRFNGYTQSQITTDTPPTDAFVDIPVTSAWQRVTLGPLKGMSGDTYLAFVCPNDAYCSPFEIDDVIVKPVLQVNTNPTYITPSCRLYPKSDSPSCDYADANGVTYKGWKGYCLEHDSQTGTCLSWWPVDIIKGESNIFGADKVSGYQDRAPLYLCAESAGKYVDATNQFYAQLSSSYSVVGEDDSDDTCHGIVNNCAGGQVCGRGASYWSVGNDPADPTNGTPSPVGGKRFDMSAADQKIYEQDIDHIQVVTTNECGMGGLNFGNLKITKETTNPGGGGHGSCDDLYKDVPWTACVSNNASGDNFVVIHFEFDQYDHHLKQIWTKGLDASNLDGGMAITPRFFMKEQCSKLVQVVTATGDNKAFSARVNSGSYKVPDLNYGKSSDLTPFGGAVQPASDILNWSALNAVQPNYSLQLAPGVSRSGSPYACNGKCDDVVCTANNISCMTNGVLDAAKVRSCQNAFVSGTQAGDCIGVTSRMASSRGPQQITTNVAPGWGDVSQTCPAALSTASCPTSKTATITVTNVSNSAPRTVMTARNVCAAYVACQGKSGLCPALGGDEVRFNKIASYRCVSGCTGIMGKYEVVCGLNSTVSYQSVGGTNTNDASFAQSHIQRLFAQSYGVYNFNTTTRQYEIATDASDWVPPKEICMKNPAASGNACGSSIQTCSQTKAVTGTAVAGAAGANDATAKVAAVANAWSQCGLKTDGTQLTKCTDSNNTNPMIGNICSTDADCLPTGAPVGYNTQKCTGTVVACSGVSNVCPGSAAYTAGTTVPFTRFEASGPCSYANNTFTCRGQCTTNKTYTLAGITPAGKAPKLIRPAYTANSTDDYCAIPPTVSNAKFVNGTSNISTVVGGSGTVSIKFNTDADPEQQPLKMIRIDWGDTTEDFAFPYAPRNDPAKPHIFSHTYVVNRGDVNHCKPFGGRFVCEFPIKIQVVDNWDWANDAARIGNQLGPDTTDDIKAQDDHANWYDTGLKVNVQP